VNDPVELRRGFRQALGQALPVGIGQRGSTRQVFGRQVEGEGNHPHPLLARRFDELGGIFRLGQDDPDRRHRRRAGAEVECKRVGLPVAQAGEHPVRRAVDFFVVGRATEAGFMQMDAGAYRGVHPGDVGLGVLARMIGDEVQRIERQRLQGGGDGTEIVWRAGKGSA